MVRPLSLLVVLFLGHAAAQDGISACSAGCISQVFSDTTALGCAANDKVCACNSANFQYAVRDCIVQACGVDGDALNSQLQDAMTASNTQCDAAKATAGESAPSSTTSVPTTTTALPESTTSPAPTSTTIAATTDASPTPTTTASTEATSTLKTSTTSSLAATKIGGSALSSSTSTASSSTSKTSSISTASKTSGAASTSTSEADATTADSSSSGSLSVAAKAGIGAGAGVALLLSAIVACYIMAKKRKPKEGSSRIPTMLISKPLPGSGRQYAHDVEATQVPSLSTYFRNDLPAPIQTAKYSPSTVSSQYSPRSMYAPSRPSRDDDHDVLGRRYEDMVTRTQPRTMI